MNRIICLGQQKQCNIGKRTKSEKSIIICTFPIIVSRVTKTIPTSHHYRYHLAFLCHLGDHRHRPAFHCYR